MNRRSSIIVIAVITVLVVISAASLAFLLRDVDWDLIRHTGGNALVLILSLTVLGTALYTLLVYLLIRVSGHSPTLWQTYLVLTASLSANYITPIKVGIPLRVFLCYQSMGIPFSTGTALIAVEALVGILVPALVAVLGITYLFPSVGPTSTVLLIAALLAGVVLVWRVPVNRILSPQMRLRFPHITRRALHFIEQVQAGLHRLPVWAVLAAAILDLLMLTVEALRMWLVLRLFCPAPSPLALLAAVSVSLTAGTISLIPMGLGVRDASLVLLLTQLDVPQALALSTAVIQRLFSPGWPLLLGIISANILGVSELTKRASMPRE
jgi:uncharacterized protein (TIRG00374 family)